MQFSRIGGRHGAVLIGVAAHRDDAFFAQAASRELIAAARARLAIGSVAAP
ncbi:MAG: hypothetical protein ABIN45_02660 [Gammaproteobacteria bacterium]